ncbi:SH3 domain-containing protein [Salibacter halophilus]|uniref:SH3 domain-containing protein n=1 Tax=Salibacter halophilus TaxID=1803916 RepID=A0A6N6M9Q3_9FLAO|nr:SH3 domain-containing protein [Salibacter halophilus]KAB1065942.1 SH3 domain-containing protein [Salibacter halophilus]
MIRSLIILYLLSFNLTNGQELQNGLILPEQNEDEEICCIYSPENGFTVYDRPDGEKIGRLTRNVDQNVGDQSFYRIYFVNHRTKTETQIGLEHFQEIAYEIWALTYSERKDGFVKITYANQDFWLKQSDIENVGFELVEWQSFLADNVNNLLGYYANDPGLNLREKPNTDSGIIRTLKGDTNQISPTNEHHGLWTKVKVIISKEHPCATDLTEEENIIEELEGWIKIVDDNGLPNLWYYSRGC